MKMVNVYQPYRLNLFRQQTENMSQQIYQNQASLPLKLCFFIALFFFILLTVVGIAPLRN